jgi:hypothetical protein
VDIQAWAPPVVRAPVAPSALVHLDTGADRPAPAGPDPEATGSREPAGTEDPAPGADRERLPWRRIAILATVAVLLGTAVGLGGSWLLHVGGNGHPGSSASTVPAGSGPPQADVGDPKLAPVIIGAQDHGTSIVLTWRDPSDGVATFVVVEVAGSVARGIRQLPPGTTHTTIDGLDPTAAQYCFALVALVGQDRAASATRCVTRSK